MSKTSIGIDVSSPTAGATDVSMSIGWKSVDAAYVPVVEITDPKKNITIVSSGDSVTRPAQSTETAETPELQLQRQKNAADVIMQLDTLNQSASKLNANEVKSDPLLAKMQESQTTQAENLSNALLELVRRKDALSVLSVIDSNSFARKDNIGMGVGKIFATGLAAQNVSKNIPAQSGACQASVRPLLEALAASGTDPQKKQAAELLKACK
jgi:hypothetical protein